MPKIVWILRRSCSMKTFNLLPLINQNSIRNVFLRSSFWTSLIYINLFIYIFPDFPYIFPINIFFQLFNSLHPILTKFIIMENWHLWWLWSRVIYCVSVYDFSKSMWLNTCVLHIRCWRTGLPPFCGSEAAHCHRQSFDKTTSNPHTRWSLQQPGHRERKNGTFVDSPSLLNS